MYFSRGTLSIGWECDVMGNKVHRVSAWCGEGWEREKYVEFVEVDN
jgi:hypothetical protein